MTDQRIPRAGEVWRNNVAPDQFAVVQSVYPDALVYLFHLFEGDKPKTMTDIPEHFVSRYRPPEPTVVASKWLEVCSHGACSERFHLWGAADDDATHRLDLMSDGEFRVVKL